MFETQASSDQEVNIISSAYNYARLLHRLKSEKENSGHKHNSAIKVNGISYVMIDRNTGKAKADKLSLSSQ